MGKRHIVCLLYEAQRPTLSHAGDQSAVPLLFAFPSKIRQFPNPPNCPKRWLKRMVSNFNFKGAIMKTDFRNIKIDNLVKR